MLIRNCINYDTYLLITQVVNRVIVNGEVTAIESGLREVEHVLRRGGVAVIDEFQRLPMQYVDLVASWAPSGLLIAAGSSYGIVNKILSKGSPLLGIMLPVKIDIISYEDVLAQLRDPILSVVYRDPWVIPFIDSINDLKNRINELALVARGLVGEIFSEENRELTSTYWRTLLLVAEGYWKSTEIAGALAIKGGLASASSILSKLTQMGLLRGIPTLGRERYYVIRSPVLSLILYAEAKYSITELGVSSIELPIGREVQFSIGEMLSNYFNATQHYSPKEDIDVVLVRGRRRVWAFEIKQGAFTQREAVEAVSKMRRIAEKVGLVSLSERPPDVGDVSIGPQELLSMAEELARRNGVI